MKARCLSYFRYIVAIIIAVVCSERAYAGNDDDRHIVKSSMIGVGFNNVLDTYLSPEKYKGTELRYISHTTFSRDSRKWSRQAVWHGYVNLSKNRAENSNELGGMIEFAYGWHYNWRLADGKLMLKAGGMVDAGGGFLYNTRNGNNPAQARIRLDVRPSAVAKYDFSVRQLPLSVRYEVDFPLAGLMFSPNYGQSYYEIFSRGNYDHNIVSTYVGNAPSVRQMLTLDVKKKRTTLRVGWLGDWQQAKPNNLKQHYYTNALLLGIVKTIK